MVLSECIPGNLCRLLTLTTVVMAALNMKRRYYLFLLDVALVCRREVVHEAMGHNGNIESE